MASSNTLDFNNKWNYPLQWIYESEQARLQYQSVIYRVDLMMKGRPFVNTYKEDMLSNLKNLSPEAQKKLGAKCECIPEGRSFELSDAVSTISNQMASGVDTYEYTINDPSAVIDDDLEQKLSTQCSIDYVENGLDLLSGTLAADMVKYGLTAVLVKYNPKTQKNEVQRWNPKNILFDTMYHANNQMRFNGYYTMISWYKLKKIIEEDGDEINLNIEAPNESIFDDKGQFKKATYSHRKIRSLNGLDIYVEDLNKLAASPSLQNSLPALFDEYRQDLSGCYNLNYYKTFATDPKAQTKNGYDGMDVELTVIYDLNRRIEFKIINRRYVISMNKRAFRRELIFPQYNPLTDTTDLKLRQNELECPLKIQLLNPSALQTEKIPTSPLYDLLDTHDKLCGWVARREHVSKILSILRIETNAADAAALQSQMNIMGIVLDNVQGDINSINFDYRYEYIDSEISRLTTEIQRHLSSYSQIDALQMMGDRASAAEAGTANSAIVQGLSNLQNALMKLYADIARQCLMNRVIYSPVQEFPIVNNGNYSSITLQDMALHAIIRVKSVMSKKVSEMRLAANSMAILGNLGSEFDAPLKALLIEQALYGQVPRKIVKANLLSNQPSEQEIAVAQQEAQNMAIALQQNQQAYTQNPLPYEVDNIMNNFSPDEVEQVIAGVSNTTTPSGTQTSEAVDVIDMPQQEGAISTNLNMSSSDLGSMLANPSSMG